MDNIRAEGYPRGMFEKQLQSPDKLGYVVSKEPFSKHGRNKNISPGLKAQSISKIIGRQPLSNYRKEPSANGVTNEQLKADLLAEIDVLKAEVKDLVRPHMVRRKKKSDGRTIGSIRGE